MGAWGAGSFDNDTAMDWVGDLKEADSIQPVIDALKVVIPPSRSAFARMFGFKASPEYLDSDVATICLSAAELVAAWKSGDSSKLPTELSEFVEKHKRFLSTELVDLAKVAVHQIRERSELAELWNESDDADTWQSELSQLEARLA